jgi:hypothetical protein
MNYQIMNNYFYKKYTVRFLWAYSDNIYQIINTYPDFMHMSVEDTLFNISCLLTCPVY